MIKIKEETVDTRMKPFNQFAVIFFSSPAAIFNLETAAMHICVASAAMHVCVATAVVVLKLPSAAH